jgi:hypothetical protein
MLKIFFILIRFSFHPELIGNLNGIKAEQGNTGSAISVSSALAIERIEQKYVKISIPFV